MGKDAEGVAKKQHQEASSPSSTRLETVGKLGMLLGISSFRKTGMIQMISGSGLIQMIQNDSNTSKEVLAQLPKSCRIGSFLMGYLEIIQLNSLYKPCLVYIKTHGDLGIPSLMRADRLSTYCSIRICKRYILNKFVCLCVQHDL